MSRSDTIGRTATLVDRRNGVLRVIYHSTAVVTVEPDGTIILDTGGWRTNTTKLRMNQASQQFNLGYSVYQKDHRWFVSSGHDEPDVEFNGYTHTILSGRQVA